MLSAAVWLMLSSMLTSLRISGGGSFPKPLTAEEERMYLQRSAAGDLEARNILTPPKAPASPPTPPDV